MMIDGTDIKVDPELAERNRQRIEEVKASMGPKWLLHPANRALSYKQKQEQARKCVEKARSAIRILPHLTNGVSWN